MVQFCPNCRSALFITKEGNVVVARCYKCGYESTPQSKTTVSHKPTMEKAVYVIERKPEYMDRVCPNCGHDKATRVNVLISSKNAYKTNEASASLLIHL